MAANTAERFWSKVQKSGNESDCWLWTAATFRDGYGCIKWKGRNTASHRVSYEIANGPIHDGLCVLHRCDVRACVNPAHLFLGTHKDNADDRERKGRGVRQVGEAVNTAKLTEQQVLEIRSRYAAGAGGYLKLAREYGVGEAAIQFIVTRRTWAHLGAA